MPNVMTAFTGLVPDGSHAEHELERAIFLVPDRSLGDRELAQAIRLALSAKRKAIHLYEALADATMNQRAHAVLLGVAEEERAHAHRFERELCRLREDGAGRAENGWYPVI